MDEAAIVLNYTKIRDNCIVLHTLTRTYGRRSFLIRVSSRTSMSYFLPLNIVELSITENPKSDLWYAKPVSLSYPLLGIRGNLFKNTISLFMAEVLYRVLKDGALEGGLYDWCERQVVTLDALDTDFSNYHIRFLLELCIALGFRPESQDMVHFSGDLQGVIEKFMSADLPSSMLIQLTGKTRNEVASAIIKYLEFHTESAINIRSLQVLREIYGQ